MPAFVPLAERIVGALLESSPDLASAVGEHGFDDRLPDHSGDAVAGQVAMLRDAAHALSEVDAEDLPTPERVDHGVLTALVDRAMFELTEVRAHEWDPLTHNPGPLLYALLARPFAPADVRLCSLAGRLAAVPDALATARAVLRDIPRVHAETAVGQFEGAAALVRDQVPELLAEAPGLRGTVEPVARQAVRELTGFADWLRTGLRDDAGPGRDPRLGRRLWEARLWHTLDEVVDFVADVDLVSLVDDPCVIREMPEHDRGVAVAYCDAPGPLETAAVPTYYCIAPTPADWPPARVESFFREYNDHMIRNLTVHEAVPGHFLQLAHARRYRGSSRARALGHSGPFIEGWAVYAEQAMVELGFGGLAVRLQQLKMQLRMTINAILDQLTHCEELTEADGLALMTGRGFQEEGEAAGKWRRALLTSTQLSTYFVGYHQVASIAARRPGGVSLRQWHDAMLAHGSPSPRHLPALLGLDEAGLE